MNTRSKMHTHYHESRNSSTNSETPNISQNWMFDGATTSEMEINGKQPSKQIGHVLWIMQLPSKLPGNDGQYLWRYDKRLYHYCLHGQHFPLRTRHGNMATLTENTRKVLQCLRDNNLFLKATKCEFNKTKIQYLGMIIEENKISMDPGKLAGIRDWPEPTTVKETWKFLGFGNYYRKFI